MHQNVLKLSFTDTLLLGCCTFVLVGRLYTPEIFALLGCYAALICSYPPTFRDNPLITSSKGAHLFVGRKPVWISYYRIIYKSRFLTRKEFEKNYILASCIFVKLYTGHVLKISSSVCSIPSIHISAFAFIAVVYRNKYPNTMYSAST